MHATQVLDKHLLIHCQETHQRRMDTVLTLVNGLLSDRARVWGQSKNSEFGVRV